MDKEGIETAHALTLHLIDHLEDGCETLAEHLTGVSSCVRLLVQCAADHAEMPGQHNMSVKILMKIIEDIEYDNE